MNWLRKTVILLSKHGLLIQTSVFVLVFLFFAAYCFADFSEECVLYSLIFGILVAWNLTDAYQENHILEQQETVKNLEDKLVLAEHDVERLRLEVETIQASLKEAEKRKAEASDVLGMSTVDTQDDGFKQKPKRPVSKRKPKPKQTENENQN